MNLDDNITKIVLAAIAVIGGSFLTFRFVRKKNSDNKTTINQNKNTVNNGDIVGGNKTTHN